MDPVLVALAFHRVTKVDWSSSGGLDDYLSYSYAMATLQVYPAEWIALVKRQKCK